MKEEGRPFKMVLDNTLEINKVITIPNRTTPVSASVEKTEVYAPPATVPPIKIEATAIKVGNPPPAKEKVFSGEEDGLGIVHKNKEVFSIPYDFFHQQLDEGPFLMDG